MDDAVIERLELKLAYLEQANQELSDVVYRQQREIDLLRAQVAGHERQLEHYRTDRPAVPLEHEKPPHY